MVQSPAFEGPLELLLQLIEKRKLFINDISLAEVTDDYIEQINASGVLALSSATHFVYVASTLLLIKSKSLLPTLTLTEEETGDIADLERRLKLYQRFKNHAVRITERFGKSALFSRQMLPGKAVFAPGKLTLIDIEQAMGSVLSQLPKVERLPQAFVEKVMSLEEMIDTLSARITKSLSLSFKEFTKGPNPGVHRSDRVNVIVSFLALLELVKRGIIGVKQDHHFEDIIIEPDRVETPRYS